MCDPQSGEPPYHSAFAISTSLATVFMLRAVPASAALILNFELAIPSP